MEEVEMSIVTYKSQLEQVQSALEASQDQENKEELKQLASDLEELISITQENLLELKRKEILAQFPDSDDEEPEMITQPEVVAQPVVEDEEEIDLSSLEGLKCRAPHITSQSGGQAAYHDAIIFSSEQISSETCDDINVRVVFSHPTQPSMLPCPYFLDGRCRFSESSCKFSHGEVVSLNSLREYEEPDFSNLAESSGVLAKDSSDHLWHHATVEGVEGGDMVHLRFSHNNKSIYTVPIEMVLPLTGGGSQDEDSQGIDNDHDDDDNVDLADFVPEQLLQRIPDGYGGPLGDWEQFTRGMGSKLMASMGYVMGAGLGKHCEGRIEPVTAMLYPSGRSLDWCMNLREKAGGGDALSVEKTLKRQQVREEKKAAKRYEADQAKTSVFDFINHTLGGKRGNVKDLIERSDPTFLLRKTKNFGNGKGKNESAAVNSASSSNSLNIQNFKVSEEIRRNEKELDKLKDSYARLKDRDPKSAKVVEVRLKEKQETIRVLRGKEKSLHNKQTKHNDKQKLAIF